jgi:hypothetical protein
MENSSIRIISLLTGDRDGKRVCGVVYELGDHIKTDRRERIDYEGFQEHQYKLFPTETVNHGLLQAKE